MERTETLPLNTQGLLEKMIKPMPDGIEQPLFIDGNWVKLLTCFYVGLPETL